MKRICSVMDCDNDPVIVEHDEFNVAGVRSVAFYDVCYPHYLAGIDRKPCPGHKQRVYHWIKGAES